MAKYYQIILKAYDVKPEITGQDVLLEGNIEFPKNCLEVGIDHKHQIDLIQKAQDQIIRLQTQEICFFSEKCPKCGEGKLRRYGYGSAYFSDIFTDHTMKFPKRQCGKCGHVETTTFKSLFGHQFSGELIKVQAELGARHSYREAEGLLALFSGKKRGINSHEQVHTFSESIGQVIDKIFDIEEEILNVKPAKELVVHVDGGRIKSVESDERSFEAMTACIYNPQSVEYCTKTNTNIIHSKHCAASSISDGQCQMKHRTIIAALKQGLSPHSKIIALCDGADNCWNIIDALEPLAGSVERILDWFHLSMKIQNIALPEEEKDKLMKVKWHLWRGDCDTALVRLRDLITTSTDKAKLKKLATYIENNAQKIVNYEDRERRELPFTSNLAESTVESLINQRYKGQKHMRWSREGLDPILQLRAAMTSNDWDLKWPTAVLSI